MSSKDIDMISRGKIRGDISSNYFVSAGAGSGKTTVLVDRMVKMVESGIDISRICTITFTKAAAGEFYARFQKKLAASASPEAKKALQNIDLCFMGTIDAFCNMILSEHPSEAGIPSDARIVTDEEMDLLYRREFSNIKKGVYGPALRDKCTLFEDCFYDAEKVFIKGLRTVLGARNAELVYVSPPACGIDEYLGERREKLVGILSYLLSHEEAFPDPPGQGVGGSIEALKENSARLLGSWDDDPGSVLSALKKLDKLRIVKEYAPRMDELGPGWEDIFCEHPGRNGKLSWYELTPDEEDPLLIRALCSYMISAACDLLHDAAPVISETLRKEGRLGFSDYLFYLRDVLRRDAASGGKLIRHIRERHSYFLIDEFQDTDPIQTEIFFYLSAEQPDPDWRKCVPVPGTLFIVGDPKQSIYRFKNADVSSFIRTGRMFEDPSAGEVLKLTRNFRSKNVLKEWFNEVFLRLMPEDTELQSRFEEIPIETTPDPEGAETGKTSEGITPRPKLIEGVYAYSMPYSRSLAESEDPGRVADITRRLTEDENLRIAVREGDETVLRRPGYRDIMVITRGKGHLPMYMKSLKDAGIPFRVEGKTIFSSCPALKSISYMLSAAADPFDKKAVFAAEKLSGCVMDEKKIFGYYDRSRKLPPSALFSLLMDEEKVFSCAGAENAEYAYFALELLRAAEADGSVSSAREAAAFISRLIEEPSEERCMQLLRDQDRVHIANLHKVKGLEAPIVILADPTAPRSDSADRRVDHSTEPPKCYIFELKRGVRTQAFSREEEEESKAVLAERVRLLYVAATRAMNVLIVSSMLKKDGGLAKSIWNPLSEHMDEDIYGALGDYVPGAPEVKSPVDTEALYDEAEKRSVLNDRTSTGPSYTLLRPSTVKAKSVTEEDDGDEAEEGTSSKPAAHDADGRDPALAGTLVHRLMEVLVSSGNTSDEDALVREIIGEYRADETIYASMLHGACRKIRSGGYPQENDVPQDILTELISADEVYCELPFCIKEDGEDAPALWNGVMDAMYKRDGSWHIIDYKTSADPDDLDERYREQLEAYKRAFRAMTGEEAEARVYHIGI